MTRAIIVDDQAVFRHKLRQMLTMAGCEVVGEAKDIPSAECLVAAVHPELALVDVRLPGLNGFDGAPRLKALEKELRIYLISAYPDPVGQLESLARASGAEAFVSKDDLDLKLIRSWITLSLEKSDTAE